MTTAELVLVLLLLVVLSSVASRLAPAIPLPFVQIGSGMVASAFAHVHFVLDPDVFLFVFVPPLLFLDGWRTPVMELKRDWGSVLRLAFGLVVFTVLGVGWLIHLMIPATPLGAAFALAAIVSPTDPVAVTSLAARVRVPRRMMRILDGEALLNDASGLSCMRIAVIALTTGGFSAASAGLSFAWTAIGGVMVGVAASTATVLTRGLAHRRFGGDAGAGILSMLLIPFFAYLAADRLGCSGIMATAAAGLAMARLQDRIGSTALQRVQSRSIWGMLQFVFNGAMFILLGLQLPAMAARIGLAARQAGDVPAAMLVVYVVAIVAALAAARFAWIWAAVHVPARHQGGVPDRPGWRAIAAMAAAGAKGAVTLAAVLGLPLTIGSGQPFPARDLLILLTAGVILLSLAVSAISLPVLLAGPREAGRDTADATQELLAQETAAKAAIAALEGQPGGAARHLTTGYRHQLAGLERAATGSRAAKALATERELRRTAIDAQRAAVKGLLDRGRINADVADKVLTNLDLGELSIG